MLKLELAIVLAAVAGGALWVEQGHRVVIDAPAAAEAQSIAAAAACPDNDTAPYDVRCLDYLNVPAEGRLIVRLTIGPEAAPAAAPCPDNDKVPYSPSCIAFMKGATETGMRWRATAQPPSIPAPQ
jgi:hypothetical protein